MSELSLMAGEPFILTVDGKKWTVAQMTIGDWAELDRWAEMRVLDRLLLKLRKFKDELELKEQIQNKIANQTQAEMKTEVEEILKTSEASIYRLYLQLRHNHKEITVEQAGQLLTFAGLIEMSRRMFGLPDKKADSDPPAEK